MRVHRPTLVVFGGAAHLPPEHRDAIDQLFRHAIVPLLLEGDPEVHSNHPGRLGDEQGIARQANKAPLSPAVVYGGTDSGVMAILGKVLAEFAPSIPLIGVAPLTLTADPEETPLPQQAPRDQNASHFIGVTDATAWGDERETLIGITERLAADSAVVALVIGGGLGARSEVTYACDRKWPILAIDGVEGTSGAIVRMVTSPSQLPLPVGHTSDAQDAQHSSSSQTIQAAIGANRITVHDVRDISGVRRTLQWRLRGSGVLREAWLRLGHVNAEATKSKPRLRTLKIAVLALGVLTTLLAIVVPQIPHGWNLQTEGSLALLTTPGIAGCLVAFIARRRRDSRWLSIRSAAQSIAREIYRFRTCAGPYKRTMSYASRSAMLAAALSAVDSRVSLYAALAPRRPGFDIWPPTNEELGVSSEDDLFGPITGAIYDSVRVENQIGYFSKKVVVDSRTLDRLLVIAYAASIVATLLGALTFRDESVGTWVALATATGAAIVAWTDSEQYEQRTEGMAMAAASIRAARERWLSREDRERPEAITAFATEVEESLEAESAQWERALRQAQLTYLSSTSLTP